MSGSITSPTAPYIDASGIHAPTYSDILTYLQNQYRGIYGSDVYLGNDSMDGQLLAVFALAISDANSAAIAVYNAYSPDTAQGAGLSSMVKINGLKREVASYSTVPLLITGNPGVTIFNGYVNDPSSNQQWNLPGEVTIPSSGQITVTGTAAQQGAISAAAGTITKIGTPTRGWQSVTNTSAASEGAAVEQDAQLRIRQASSTMQASITASEGLVGAVEALPNVTRLQLYENKGSSPDTNGIPGHSIALVVEGGDAQQIANTIFARKTIGCGTYGTTQMTVVDTYGVPNTINFFFRTQVPITIAIVLTPLLGYTTTIGQEVIQACINYINALPIGTMVVMTKLFVPANLTGADAETFDLVSISLARGSATPAPVNIPIAFNEAAYADTTTVSVTIGS